MTNHGMRVALIACVTGCLHLGDNDNPDALAGTDDVEETGHGSTGTGGGGAGGGGGTGAGGGSGSTTTPLRVFVTRGSYTGQLTSYAEGIGDGLAAADAICQVRADAAELGGTWVAWLSSSQVDALDRVAGTGPWTLIGGQVAFHNRAQLQTEPSVPLARDEHGQHLDDCYCSRVYVWTGTRAGGLRDDATCGDWTSSNTAGTYGSSYYDPSFAWTDAGQNWCDESHHLLCLEQP